MKTLVSQKWLSRENNGIRKTHGRKPRAGVAADQELGLIKRIKALVTQTKSSIAGGDFKVYGAERGRKSRPAGWFVSRIFSVFFVAVLLMVGPFFATSARAKGRGKSRKFQETSNLGGGPRGANRESRF